MYKLIDRIYFYFLIDNQLISMLIWFIVEWFTFIVKQDVYLQQDLNIVNFSTEQAKLSNVKIYEVLLSLSSPCFLWLKSIEILKKKLHHNLELNFVVQHYRPTLINQSIKSRNTGQFFSFQSKDKGITFRPKRSGFDSWTSYWCVF